MKTIKDLLKEQREICADQIKDMNFTLAEIVRIAPEPDSIPMDAEVMQKIVALDMNIDNVDNYAILTKKLRINNEVPDDEIWVGYDNGKIKKFKIK